MAEGFPLKLIPPTVAQIAAKLIEAGYEAWYVGGAVRDALLGAKAGDFDITTSATPAQVQQLFRRTVPIGIDHGTVAVLDDRNVPHEVTTFRRDVKTDGRHAVVEFGVSLDEDLARRDFTINAIAVHPTTGEVRDPFDGRRDLGHGIVRAVGDPAQRFREDRLRVLRGLRFSATLGFSIDTATWTHLIAASTELEHLSRERVRDEWLKTLGRAPRAGVRAWRKAALLEKIWPELVPVGETHEMSLELLQPEDPVLATAFLFHLSGSGATAAEGALRRLRFSNQDVSRVMAVIEALQDASPDPQDRRRIRYWLSRHRGVWQDVVRNNELREEILRVLDSGVALSIGDLVVTGDDLREAGITPGPMMGKVLRQLLSDVLDDPMRNTREVLLARAQAMK